MIIYLFISHTIACLIGVILGSVITKQKYLDLAQELTQIAEQLEKQLKKCCDKKP